MERWLIGSFMGTTLHTVYERDVAVIMFMKSAHCCLKLMQLLNFYLLGEAWLNCMLLHCFDTTLITRLFCHKMLKIKQDKRRSAIVPLASSLKQMPR